MPSANELAAIVYELRQKVAVLEGSRQLGNSTIETAAGALDVTAAAAAGTDAAAAVPDLEEGVAAANTGIDDAAEQWDAFNDDLDARFEDMHADLDGAQADIEASMAEIDTTFSTQYEGLSGDVDTAIRAAGSAKTEAEAASEAARTAAGLAASKGETIVQVSAPTGSRANAANLWIDISTNADGAPKNQPNRYNPDTAKWEPITDAQTVAAALAAATAVTAAQAAKDVAAQANTAAGVAQQTASDANAAALAAAGIANGKGKVIYQASKPTGANAAVGNLWIRSSDNTPWAYDTSSSDWVQVTDKAATDAAAAAAAANQAAVAASNAAKAAQATADSKPLILFSSTAGPSGTAPTGTIWFLWDSAKNVAGQWLQSGTLAAPVWTPQQIRSEVIANLDVAKLTVGSAAIADLVAQKIAASTANFQTANVSNLFVTQGATMSQAVIDFLFVNVVQAKKITAGMIDVDSLNGVTLVGALIKSAASGQRVEITSDRVQFFTSSNDFAGAIYGAPESNVPGAVGPSIYLGGVNGVGGHIGVGVFTAGNGDRMEMQTNAAGISRLYVTSIFDSSAQGKPIGGAATMPSTYGGGQAAQSIASGSSTQYLRPAATTETANLRKVISATDCYWIAPFTGFYAIHVGGVFSSAANGARSLEVMADAAIIGRDGDTIAATAAGLNVDLGIPVVYIQTDQRIRLRAQQSSGAAINFTIDSLAIRYVGPV